MTTITNPKIEKVKTEIAKTKAKIAEYQAKLRDQERQVIDLENLEIVAMFRNENLSDDFIAKLRERQNTESAAVVTTAAREKAKEEKLNDAFEN